MMASHEDHALIGNAISWTAKTQFAKSPRGMLIMALLTRAQHRNGIRFAELTARGNSAIAINGNFKSKLLSLAPTLVHEASHNLWRIQHHKHAETIHSQFLEELQCQRDEIEVYRQLRDEVFPGAQTDSELELRIKREEAGTLKSVIYREITENRTDQDEYAPIRKHKGPKIIMVPPDDPIQTESAVHKPHPKIIHVPQHPGTISPLR